MDFLHRPLGPQGPPVFRLGLSGSYRPGERALRHGLESGMNYLFWFYWDTQMTRVLREVLPRRRDELVLATGGSNFGLRGRLGARVVAHAIEDCRRALRVDALDVFHLFWVGRGGLSAASLDVLREARQRGRLRKIAVSTHDRAYAAELAAAGALDLVMLRYNAAHRGAERDVFPALPGARPAVVAYTATCWGRLLQAPRGWPAGGRVPSAGDCYRFVLGQELVDVCLTAPRSLAELEGNLAAVARGPLAGEDEASLRGFGDAVYAARRGRAAVPRRS